MTGRCAGYASVVTVGASFVNDMLAAAASLAPTPKFSLPSLVTVGSDKIGLDGSLSLVPPTVSFASNPLNQIGVNVGATGTARLTSGGADLVEVEVTLSASLQVGLIVDVSASKLAFGVDLSHASLTAIGVKVEFGPPLATVYEQALKSGDVLGAFSDALRSIPAEALAFTVPGATGTLEYTLSGVRAKVTVSGVAIVPLDGDVLDIAMDVASYTSGDPTQLVNLITTPGPSASGFVYDAFGDETFVAGLFESHAGYGVNLAAAVNATFLTALVNGPIASELAGRTISGVTIDSLSISVAAVESVIGQSELPTNWWDSLAANISGSYEGVGFNFNASVTPVSISQPSSSFWDFTLVAYNYSSTALAVLDVLFPIAPVIGPLILNSTIASLIANVIAALPSEGFGYTGSQPLPGVPGWNVNYTVTQMALWAPEIEIDAYVAASVSGPPSPSPSPPSFLLAASPHSLADPSPIPVTLTVGASSLLDPELNLRIAWTAVRDDTGLKVLSQDTALTAAALTVMIDRWSGDLTYNDSWAVTCEVYRPADALTPRYVYFNRTVTAGVSDVVDRHRPYVHWDHVAWFHDPHGPPPLKHHRFWTRSRHSRIHRTDLKIRCEILDKVFAAKIPPSPKYLDSIASHGDLADVERWRHGVLCDYCFFGGPTRTVWKTPTHPTPTFV